jgi:formylglycine-generating enzyme required for sulfatase activity
MKLTLTVLAALLPAPLALLHATEPITNSIGMKLVRIEPGSFVMGQDGPPMEDYLRQKRMGEMHKDFDRIDFDEKPAHPVTITQPFLMGDTEVTVAQFRQFDPEFKRNDPTLKPAQPDAASHRQHPHGARDSSVLVQSWRFPASGGGHC